MAKQFVISLNGTFVVEPLLTPMRFWGSYQPKSVDVRLSAYNQMFQDLLSGKYLNDSSDVVVICLRFQDWLKSTEDLIENIKVFADALLSSSNEIDFLVFLCPSNSEYVSDELHKKLYEMLISFFELSKKVNIFDVVEILESYNLPNFLKINKHTDVLGHLPYTQKYYDVLAAIINQKIHQHYLYNTKVIVLDCDNTLWDGVCGEVGWDGIKITKIHRQFQKMLVNLHDSGVLLCLCSKNNFVDVKMVIDRNDQMLLEWKHLVNVKINWLPKSVNISELSEELNIGLDQFVIFDDNPVEGAEIKASLDKVNVVILPTDYEKKSAYLSRSWVLKKGVLTEEDSIRTQLYHEESVRSSEMKNTQNLVKFFENLDLDVTIHNIRNSEISRVSQLTQRTNQFNFAKHEYTEQEIKLLINNNETEILTVYVKDRFGEYGLVGLLFYHDVSDNLRRVENFLLSCRVLGRGVEHRVINLFSDISLKAGINKIEFYLVDNEKNIPAKNFVRSLNKISERQYLDGNLVSCLVKQLSKIKFDPFEANNSAYLNKKKPSKTSIVSSNKQRYRNLTQEREGMLISFEDINDMENAIYGNLEENADVRKRYDDIRSKVSSNIRQYLNKIISTNDFQDDDNIWEFGITSLKVVQILGLVYENYNVSLPYSAIQKNTSIKSITDEVIQLLQGERITEEPSDSQKLQDFFPLSNQQELVWSKEILEKKHPALNVSSVHKIFGKVDVEKLQFALNCILRNSDALRSNFVLKGSKIVQKFANITRFPLKVYQLNHDQKKQGWSEINRWVNKFSRKRFHIDRSVLCRAALLEIHDKEYILIFSFHHLIMDEWSLTEFYNRLSDYYNHHTNDTTLNKKLSDFRQYFEYVTSQKARVDEKAESYWINKLSKTKSSYIPSDYSMLDKKISMKSIHVDLSSKLYESLLRNPDLKPYTQFEILLASLLITLRYHMNAKCPHIATAFSNRNNPKFQHTIGLFTQVFPVFCEISNRDSFLDVLNKLKAELYECSLKSEVSLSRIFGLLGVHPGLNPHPFFQIAVLYYPKNQHPLVLNNASVEPYTNNDQFNQFDIVVILQEIDNSIRVEFKFNSNYFHNKTIERLAYHYLNVLDQLISKQNIKIDQINLLDSKELLTLLKWSRHNKTYKKYSLLQVFENQVKKFDSKVAVQSQEKSMTYKELDEQSTFLANYLIESYDVDDSSNVAILQENSVDYIISILSVLKANATFVTIDPELPKNRIQYICKQINLNLFLVGKKHADKAALAVDNSVFIEDILDNIDSKIDNSSSQRRLVRSFTRTNTISAILFTSGTQGNPKPTMISDSSILQISKNLKYITIKPEDNIAQFSRLTFDVSLFEIWSALLNGATLSIFEWESRLNYNYLQEKINEFGVNTLTLTASHFDAMVFNNIHVFDNIDRLIVGGEQLKAKTLNTLMKNDFAPRKIFHAYGITEATAITHLYPVGNFVSDPIPIGYPVCGMTAVVLDEFGKLASIGTWGELFLSGEGLSPGYIGCDEENRKRFLKLSIPMFSDKPIRFYKTGDRVRFCNNGVLEYAGRIDRQIKSSGIRIEVDEVEKAYLSIPEVQSVTVQPEEKHNTIMLVAYIKLKDSLISTVGQKLKIIKSQLSSWLPKYMIPSCQYAVSKIPLTSHGKISVKDIEKYIITHNEEVKFDDDMSLKNDGVLQSLKQIWLETLNIDDCGYDVSFFELGGSSLLFTTLLANLQEKFSVAIVASDALKRPTIRNISEIVRNNLNFTSEFANFLQPIQLGFSRTLAMIHPISGLVVDYFSLAKYLKMNIIGIVSPSLLDESFKFKSINEMAKFYIEALSHFKYGRNFSIAGWSFGGLVALEMARIAQLMNIEIDQIFLIDTYYPDTMNKRSDELFNGMNDTLSIAKYHIALAKKHRPEFHGRFNVIEALEGRDVSEIKEDRLGWSALKDADIDYYYVSGTHNELFSGDHTQEVCICIQQVLKNSINFKINMLIDRFKDKNSSGELSEPKNNLSLREAEIAINILNNSSAKEIAKLLGVSHRTIESHLENLKYKFKVTSKSELIDKIRELLLSA